MQWVKTKCSGVTVNYDIAVNGIHLAILQKAFPEQILTRDE